MQLKSSSDLHALHGQPRSDATDFTYVCLFQGSSVQDLVARAKRTPEATQLLQLVKEARDLKVQIFHYAAAIGDRDFFSVMMAFLPLENFVKELHLLNQNGMTPVECAKTMHPSLAKDIEAFLFSRGVLLNFQNFAVAASTNHVVPSPSPAFDQVPGGVANVEDPTLKRVEVGPSRYIICSNTASTVRLTLRANSIHYAAMKAVYVRQVRSNTLDELASYGDKLLAFSDSDTTLSFVWSGSKIAELAKEKSFRAAFKTFSPCKNASQQLAPGMCVLLDLENLSPPPSAEGNLMILRCYASPGTFDMDTPTHHKACLSDAGVRVADRGYRDDNFLKGFRRGWYEQIYFRTVGDHPNRFLSGGNAGDPYKFNVRAEHDFGYDNKRVMIKLPDEGIVYCRGVGDDYRNPEMACVLFDSSGKVRDRYGYLGKLGRWNDIVQ